MSCIVYQLPSGRVVYLTVKQFLEMTEDDIKYLDTNGFGTNANNPFRKLPYADKDSEAHDQIWEDEYDDEDQEDYSIDYNEADEDDDGYTGPIDYDQLS